MKREQDEGRGRHIDHSLARLRDAVEPLSEDEFRTMARAASAQDRPLLRPRARNWPLRLRWSIVAIAVALLVGSGLGFGLGSSVTPSGGAAESPAGLGFLPERGWQVVRSAFEASPERPSFAIASNVPLTRLDVRLSRRADWSGHPHRALETLGPGGIVIVASFALRGVHGPSDQSFPRRDLPLRLRDSALGIRPSFISRRAGWYELRAAVGDYNVIVNVYFGTPRPARASIIAAQKQLDRLVVGSTTPAARVFDRALPLRPAVTAGASGRAASRAVDRTFVCTPIAFGGIGDLDVNASPLREDNFGRRFVATLEARTGAWSADQTLVVARALRQPEHPGLAYNHSVGGAAGVFAHSRRCVPARAALPLSSRGLDGPPVAWQKDLDCPVRGRVFVRVRAVLRSPDEWGRVDRFYAGVRQSLVEAKLAVRLQTTGKPIAYLELGAGGRTKLWYSSACS